MSIETEFQSTIQNVQNAYNGLNNLGATIPQNKTIENIKSCLDEIYDNLPKTSFQEGTEITLSNTLKGKLDYDNGVVGIGQTEQDSTTGKNLLNYIDNLRTNYGGLTSIINADGSITTTGIPASDYVTIVSIDITNLLENGQRYYISQKTEQAYTLYLQVNIKDNETSAMSYCSLNTGTSNSFVADTTNKTYRMNLQTGTISSWSASSRTITNFYQLEKGSSATSFEKYTGGQASPNPSYPQEIKYVRGKNRFDIGTSLDDYFQTNTNGTKPGSWTVNAVTATIVGNKLTIDTYNSSGWNWLSKWVELEPNTDYTISGTNTSVLKIVGFNSNELQTQGTQIIQKTADASDSVKTFNSGDYKYYCLSCFPEATGKYFENIQIEEGTQATPYLPYNTIEEVVSGINFFEAKMATDTGAGVTVTNNNDGTFTLNGTATGNTTFRLDQLSRNSQDNLKTYENGTYTLSIGNSKSGLGMAMMQIDTYRTFMYIGGGSSLVSRTLTNATSMFIYLDITSGTQFNNFVVKPMLVKGTYTVETLPSFEPYITPTSYQLSLGDIELNTIGNYKDELIYDVDEDKVYKKAYVGKATLNGVQGSFSKPSTNRFNIDGIISDYAKLDNEISTMADFYKCYANKTTADDFNSLVANENYGLDLSSGTYPTIRVKDTRYDNTDQYKAWLSTNNVTIYYIKATPTLTEITDTTLKAQVKAWYNAHSNNGTTIITSNGNLPMIIKVRGLKGE